MKYDICYGNMQKRYLQTEERGMQREVCWEDIKDMVYPCLVSPVWGREILSHAAHQEFLDLAVCYYIRIGDGRIAWLPRESLGICGIQEERLDSQAVRNAQEDGYKFQDIRDILQPMLGDGMHGERAGFPVFVLTNRQCAFGAAGILVRGMVAGLAEKMGTDLYILPSSIHELLFLPADNGMDAYELGKMVREVNQSMVEQQDRLGDHAYYYDRKADEIRIPKMRRMDTDGGPP